MMRVRMPFVHKNIRLHASRYVGERSYFVTICCERRRPIFAKGANAEWLVDHLQRKVAAFDFSVYAYCVMPDHLHALVTGLDAASDLLAFVEGFKQATSHEYHEKHSVVLWQKKFYDRILRASDNFNGVAGYIWMNPVRKGLATDARDYLFSGSFVVNWKKLLQPIETWVPEWKSKAGSPPTEHSRTEPKSKSKAPSFPADGAGTHTPRKQAATKATARPADGANQLTSYDPAFEKKMEKAEGIFRRYRHTLRVLSE